MLSGGMSQMFRLLFLGNGWADCVEIWHALGDPLVTAYAVVTGGVSLSIVKTIVKTNVGHFSESPCTSERDQKIRIIQKITNISP